VSAEPRIDVVVVAYSSADSLRGCVEPLAGREGIAVTVVDNASPTDDVATIADLPVHVVRAAANRGFGTGCNLGIAVGDSPYVLILNPDTRMDAEALGVLVEKLEREPDLGLVAPRLVDDAGELMLSQRRFPRLRTAYAKALFLHRVSRRAGWTDDVVGDRAAYDRPGRPDWVTGACLLFRRSALELVGGFDEGFFLYCEETDLCLRMREAGLGVAYEPGATVVHDGGGSAPRSSLLWVHARSRMRYARKHRSWPAARVEAVAILLEALSHALANVRRPAVARGHAKAALRLLSADPG
jgi:GT2 family glycosyltransferase